MLLRYKAFFPFCTLDRSRWLRVQFNAQRRRGGLQNQARSREVCILPAMILLLLYIFFALGTSFVCSVLEAVLLSVSVYQLMPLAEAGNSGAQRMIALKRERADDAITSILVLNTIAHTIGATLAGAQAAEVFGSNWVGVFSAVLTVLILVGTEIIPKTAGHTYALELSGIAASTITWMIRLLTPMVAASRLIRV